MHVLRHLTPYLGPYEPMLHGFYIKAIVVPPLMMIAAGVVGTLSPTLLSNNGGLTLEEIPHSEKNKAVSSHLQTLTRTTKAWILMFAGRDVVIGVVTQLFNYYGMHQALSLLFTFSFGLGALDCFSVWKYGVPGAYKVHLYPTLAMLPLAPLGIWLYWR